MTKSTTPSSDISIHPSAIVDEGAQIGAGSKVWHWTHVCSGAILGERCSLGQNVYIGNRVTMGNNVRVQNNVSIYDNVTLEDDVFCGPSMVFTNVLNPRAHISRKHEYRSTLIRRGASIGANATVVCGTTIGRYAFIAAGAVVSRDVPDHALMVGVPARRTGWVCQCGVKAASPAACAPQCTVHCPDCHTRLYHSLRCLPAGRSGQRGTGRQRRCRGQPATGSGLTPPVPSGPHRSPGVFCPGASINKTPARRPPPLQ